MNKNAVVACAVVVLVAGIAAFFLVSSRQTSVVSQTQKAKEAILKKLPSTTLKVLVDDAGFSFSYPEDLIIAKEENLNSNTYADISLASSRVKGSTRITVSDTTFASADAWFKKQPLVQESVKDTTLAELSAREVKTKDTIVTAAVDEGVLFVVATTFSNETSFWESVHAAVTSQFLLGSSTRDSTFTGLDDGAVVEEEVIE